MCFIGKLLHLLYTDMVVAKGQQYFVGIRPAIGTDFGFGINVQFMESLPINSHNRHFRPIGNSGKGVRMPLRRNLSLCVIHTKKVIKSEIVVLDASTYDGLR